MKDFASELGICSSVLSVAVANNTMLATLLHIAEANATRLVVQEAERAAHWAKVHLLFWVLAAYSVVSLGTSCARAAWYLKKGTTRVVAQRNPAVFPLDW